MLLFPREKCKEEEFHRTEGTAEARGTLPLHRAQHLQAMHSDPSSSLSFKVPATHT